MEHIAALAVTTSAESLLRGEPVSFFNKVDRVLASAGGTVVCQAGCSYCCNYRVMVTAFEALSIASYVSKLPKETADEIQQALQCYVAQTSGMTPQQHMQTNIQCVFLKNDLCSIYEQRPFACRRHHEARDRGTCQRTYEDPLSTEHGGKYQDKEMAAQVIDSMVLGLLNHYKRDGSKYEMHAAVLSALCEPDAHRRFMTGQVAFPEVSHRASFEDIIAGRAI